MFMRGLVEGFIIMFKSWYTLGYRIGETIAELLLIFVVVVIVCGFMKIIEKEEEEEGRQ